MVQGKGKQIYSDNAIHDNIPNEIALIEEKETPHDNDVVIIEDSEDSNTKKKVKKSNIGGGAGSGEYKLGINEKLILDDDEDTYIICTADDIIRIYIGNGQAINIGIGNVIESLIGHNFRQTVLFIGIKTVYYNSGSTPSAIAGASIFYAKDVTASSEMHVIDEGGNITQLSPHDKYKNWIHRETNANGVFLEVRMLLMNLELERKLNRFKLRKIDYIIINDKNGKSINKRKLIKKLRKLYRRHNDKHQRTV